MTEFVYVDFQKLEEAGNSYSGGESTAIGKVKMYFDVCMNISEKEGNQQRMLDVSHLFDCSISLKTCTCFENQTLRLVSYD